jgi:hypothetical protein
MRDKENQVLLALRLGREFIKQTHEVLADTTLWLAEEECTGVSGGVLVLTGDLPAGSDAGKITVAAAFGCKCPSCLEAALRAVAAAFDSDIAEIETTAQPASPIMGVH